MHSTRILTAAALSVAAALSLIAAATAADAGGLSVRDAWVRATPGPNGAAYMTLVNEGQAPDRLVSVSTPAAPKAELHAHSMDGAVMRMRPVEAVEVSPGEPSVMQPGGMHVMLLGLPEPLRQGATIRLTLRFERTGEIAVEAPVLGAGAMGPPGADASGRTPHGPHGHGAHTH